MCGYPRERHPELPYFAARKLSNISREMAEIVLLPSGEEFARRLHKLNRELAAIRRAVRDRGLIGIDLEAEA